MEAYDLSRKLMYAGSHSPIPFTTGPQFTNGVPAVPVLSMLRIFLSPELWSEDNVKIVAREVARVLGPTEQFDVGIARANVATYGPAVSASGVTARLIKLDPENPEMVLRIRNGVEDKAFRARFPRLEFEPMGEDFWQSLYSSGAVKPSSQP